MKQTIVIVEDDAAFGVMLKGWFKKNGYDAVLCQSVGAAKAELEQDKADLVLSDLRLPDGDGIMLLAWIKERKLSAPVIIMTSYGEVQSAVASIKLGAEDYMEKPINPTLLREKVDRALNRQKKETQPISNTNPSILSSPTTITGTSNASQILYQHIGMVAPTKLSVLILGESGTGKEYAARTIHELSTRKGKPFLAVDCGSLSRELAPSELFGHKKGSFTSAINDKKGVFEQANGGTVFLDEVGNLSYEVQVQLLRALQERKIRPVGSATDITVDVRILSATNEDLQSAIAEGRFREDLYHRLNEFAVSVPPLRERLDDLETFALHFLKEANDELGRNILEISPSAIEQLKQNRWSGNLRELRNVIRRAALFTTGNVIQADSLPLMATLEPQDMALMPDNEEAQIAAALKKARGNKSLAAKMLQIDRKTLYNKMHQYGMDL